jgi:hypothetical protein
MEFFHAALRICASLFHYQWAHIKSKRIIWKVLVYCVCLNALLQNYSNYVSRSFIFSYSAQDLQSLSNSLWCNVSFQNRKHIVPQNNKASSAFMWVNSTEEIYFKIQYTCLQNGIQNWYLKSIKTTFKIQFQSNHYIYFHL